MKIIAKSRHESLSSWTPSTIRTRSLASALAHSRPRSCVVHRHRHSRTGSFESNHVRLWTLSTLMFVPMPWNRPCCADRLPQSKCRRQVAVGPPFHGIPREILDCVIAASTYAPREATHSVCLCLPKAIVCPKDWFLYVTPT